MRGHIRGKWYKEVEKLKMIGKKPFLQSFLCRACFIMLVESHCSFETSFDQITFINKIRYFLFKMFSVKPFTIKLTNMLTILQIGLHSVLIE